MKSVDDATGFEGKKVSIQLGLKSPDRDMLLCLAYANEMHPYDVIKQLIRIAFTYSVAHREDIIE